MSPHSARFSHYKLLATRENEIFHCIVVELCSAWFFWTALKFPEELFFAADNLFFYCSEIKWRFSFYFLFCQICFSSNSGETEVNPWDVWLIHREAFFPPLSSLGAFCLLYQMKKKKMQHAVALEWFIVGLLYTLVLFSAPNKLRSVKLCI